VHFGTRSGRLRDSRIFNDLPSPSWFFDWPFTVSPEVYPLKHVATALFSHRFYRFYDRLVTRELFYTIPDSSAIFNPWFAISEVVQIWIRIRFCNNSVVSSGPRNAQTFRSLMAALKYQGNGTASGSSRRAFSAVIRHDLLRRHESDSRDQATACLFDNISCQF